LPQKAPWLECENCQAEFSLAEGFLDLHPDTIQCRSFAQRLMEWPPLVALYESRWWRASCAAWLFGLSFQEERALIMQSAGLQGQERVLDLACGPGTFTLPFARQLPEGLAVGLDLSVPMLTLAVAKTRKATLNNVLFVHANAEHLSFADNEFHHVNCSGALHLFSDLPQALREIQRVLRPGGLMTATACRNPRPGAWINILEKRHHRHFGVQLFRPEALQRQILHAGLTQVRWLHKKRYWMIFSARKPM
jgi:ubiquinone/menaquinone biosynthesis C-methylase UbiE